VNISLIGDVSVSGVFDMRTGVANLPLHGGRAPPWLFNRMVGLAATVVKAQKLKAKALGLCRCSAGQPGTKPADPISRDVISQRRGESRGGFDNPAKYDHPFLPAVSRIYQ